MERLLRSRTEPLGWLGRIRPFSLLVTSAILVAILQASPCHAQFANPFNNASLHWTKSPIDPKITIGYTVPTDVCQTVFSEQQQYSGWVSIPGDYPTKTFFWFVAARDATPLLTVYINGGPGASSMFGMFAEAGPCEVVEKGDGLLTTAAREWGWDRASNMLFIDQPTQVGFSYDEPKNGTLSLTNYSISVPPISVNNASEAILFRNGTFASQNGNHTANTTTIAATAIYHVMQGFLSQFSTFNPPNSSLGVNLFAESYGGHYGPAIAAEWTRQNTLRKNTTSLNSTTVDIHLSSLGIINGCIDDLISGPYYASMLVNNSYGLEVVAPLQAALVNASFYSSGGCAELINNCRSSVASSDPKDAGNSSVANSACSAATDRCSLQMIQPYLDSGRSFYDIAHVTPDSYPSSLYIGYLNSLSVQNAMNASINYTDTSDVVYSQFSATGDHERGDQVSKLAALLNSGVRIGMMYGDRDFGCNWLGGEAVSLAIAQAAGGTYASRFPSAGYAPVIVNETYIGGMVRQFGNLSFSRIYQSGHFVPAYQPETAFQVFARIILGTDVGTGQAIDLSTYNTTGPANATATFSLPSSPSATCFLLKMGATCGDDQVSNMLAGQGVVINDVWYAASSDWPGATASTASPTPTTSDVSGSVVPVSSSTQTLTGVFTATSTPTNGAVALMQAPPPSSLAAVTFTVWLFFCIGSLI